MDTKRVVVLHETKRKFVQVDFESLTNTMDAVRRKWNLSERFILQGKFGEREDLVDIDDDDDLAAFKDAAELFVCLAPRDEAARATSSESPDVSTISTL
jgi:hypothetical protein